MNNSGAIVTFDTPKIFDSLTKDSVLCRSHNIHKKARTSTHKETRFMLFSSVPMLLKERASNPQKCPHFLGGKNKINFLSLFVA